MKIISHRGNLEGRIPSEENNPDYIEEAIRSGFDVEIDLWLYENGFYLGHDEPEYQIDLNFLKNERLWVHAKSMKTAEFLYKQPLIHWLWHETDKMTLTSKGYIWCFPGYSCKDCIIVDKDGRTPSCSDNIWGVCTDYPYRWRNQYAEQVLALNAYKESDDYDWV